MFLFANMFEDPVWCFLNMRREMKAGVPGLSLQILWVGLKANNWSVQSHFQVTKPEQQRKKHKTITTEIIKASY